MLVSCYVWIFMKRSALLLKFSTDFAFSAYQHNTLTIIKVCSATTPLSLFQHKIWLCIFGGEFLIKENLCSYTHTSRTQRHQMKLIGTLAWGGQFGEGQWCSGRACVCYAEEHEFNPWNPLLKGSGG